ncbi:hypothetical protein CPB84DRAFT_1759049 [Gymnopilus junonius]|uniref:Cytochrome c oxidase assembly factor 3 n=1 Tax=Gymnopilus junonius TaxID=109634 RepID=A0A9P5P3X0_GYMJU|nr:hypothetical protein CPB84DRAFT_1759049 [Gymnopilus junonius]
MSQYVDKKAAQKSYRPVAGSMSPGLKRAREPFRVKNAILGISLAAFAVGVWAYSISAVKQDVFDDVDEEAEALASTGTGTGLGVGVLAKTPVESPPVVVTGSMGEPELTAASKRSEAATGASKVLEEVREMESKRSASAEVRGVLPRLLGDRFPRLLDPEKKTLVWGAPSVDNMGKISNSSNRS